MPVTPSNAPSLSVPGVFSPEKGAQRVRFQQQIPIVDSDLNDAQDTVAHAAGLGREALLGGGDRLPTHGVPRQFTVVPVSRGTAPREDQSDRNDRNFAVTPGVLHTRLGSVDTRHLRASANKVIFDYARIVSLAAEDASDEPYANYLFAGKVTAGGVGNTESLVDENKSWSSNHRLLGTSADAGGVVEVVLAGSANPHNDGEGPSDAILDHTYRIWEPTCRVVFITGDNAGEVVEIASLIGETELEFSAALPNPLALGDEYIIIPGNALVTLKDDYDSDAVGSSPVIGLSAGYGHAIFYAQTWLEDVSGDEDPDLIKAPLDKETVHYTQLRWCVRSCCYLSSTANNAGMDSLRDVHIRSLIASLGGDRYEWNIGTGVRETDEELSSLSFPTQVPLNQSGSVEVAFSNPSYWEQVRGITSLQIRLASRGYLAHADNSANVLPIVGLQLLYALASDTSVTDITPLFMFAAPSKPNGAAELSPFFYPGAPIPIEAASANFTGDDSMPMVPMVHRNPEDAVAGVFVVTPGSLLVPDQQWLDLPRLATEIMASTGFHMNSVDGDTNLLRYSQYVPLVYGSLASRLSRIETILLGSMGLGSTIGFSEGGNSRDSGSSERIGSSRNFVPNGAAHSLTQAGQGNNVFAWSTGYQINPSTVTRGAVTIPDPIASTVADTSTPSTASGVFLPGQGKYLLRDGTSILPTSAAGWSFYRNTGFDNSTDPEANFAVRKFESGVAQAALVNQGLAFRKLALKTVAHANADLFTYDVRPPWEVNAMADGDVVVPRHWTINEHAGLGGEDHFATMSMASMPPFLDASLPQALTAVHRTSFDSNSVGGLPVVGDLLPTQSAWKNNGQTLPLGQGTAPGTRNIQQMPKVGANWTNEADVQVSNDGAWGRFPLTEGDGVNMTDTWASRCTSMRLRYHIGDFYPGPKNSDDVTSNALVDTLNLYVRIEPLPLVHWATLPKHAHTVIRDSMRSLAGLKKLAEVLEVYHYGHSEDLPPKNLLDSSFRPLRTELTQGTAYTAQGDPAIGEIDWRDSPFADGFQPFIHWYHPNMDRLKGPHPASGTDYTGELGGDRAIYTRWGERSLIIPSIVYNPDPMDIGPANNDNTTIAPSAYVFEGTGASNGVDEAAGGADAGTGSDDEVIELDKLGSHHNVPSTMNSGASGSVTLRNGSTVTIDNDVCSFPFIPTHATTEAQPSFYQQGSPGPVFIPAFRSHLGRNTSGTATTITGYEFRGSHAVFKTRDTHASNAFDHAYFPQTDRMNDLENEGGNGVNYPWGKGSWYGADRNSDGGGDSAFDWTVPVLRAHIRTSTVAAMFMLFRGESTFENPAPPVFSDDDTIAGSGVDSPTDVSFLGDIGCSIAMASGGGAVSRRTFYVSPLVFSQPMAMSGSKKGEVTFGSDVGDSEAPAYDAFQLAAKDIENAYAYDSEAAWLPVLSVLQALYNTGLQQKLLFNSSLRIQHARPGGGYKGGAAHTRSTNPKSLTELFLVRNRQTGAAISWPRSPTNPEDKPFLHLFSMHPSAAGGGSYTEHPNYDYIGHLYPMIADNLGSHFSGVMASGDDLSDPATDTDTGVYAAEFALSQFTSGVQGESYAADAFDIHFADANKSVQADVKIAYSDRLGQNSGIEIDLVSELRYVRDNAAAHGLDQVGAGGRSWLDLMPTAEDMMQPGDHEIIFTLYTGRYGQKMIDSDVPDGYNPSFAGCRIIASLEVNRPNEKLPSTAGGVGKHYGLNLDTHHILGHS